MSEFFDEDKKRYDLYLKALRRNGFDVGEFECWNSAYAKVKEYNGKKIFFDTNLDPEKENLMWAIVHIRRYAQEAIELLKESGLRYFLTDQNDVHYTKILILIGE